MGIERTDEPSPRPEKPAGIDLSSVQSIEPVHRGTGDDATGNDQSRIALSSVQPIEAVHSGAEKAGTGPTSSVEQRLDSPPPDIADGAQENARDVIQVVDNPAGLPAAIKARLNLSDTEAMNFPVEIHDRVMSGGESFEKFSHYDWNDAGQTAERQAVTLPHDPERPMIWVRNPVEGKEEFVFDAIADIRKTTRGGQLTDAEVGQLGRDFAPSDPHEGLGLAGEFNSGRSREEARNARYAISFEPGAHVTYIQSVVAPQDSPLENRTGAASLLGGDKQIFLLGYDTDRSSITVSPVGGRVQFAPDGSMRFGYRDRPI
jgi:hypothetical protein